MNKPDLVFQCRKCGHLLFCSKKTNKIKEILKTECPNCGEEPDENWILLREGNYEKEFNKHLGEMESHGPHEPKSSVQF